MIAATVMMGIYIWFRFELRFGIGAVIALIHDVLVTIGALMLANYEFDLTIVAALLTIVGFSVNDTVIVCDRIRENMRKIKRESSGEHYQYEHQRDPEPNHYYHRYGDPGALGAFSSRRAE